MPDQPLDDHTEWLDRELRRIRKLLGTTEALQEQVDGLKRENMKLSAELAVTRSLLRWKTDV